MRCCVILIAIAALYSFGIAANAQTVVKTNGGDVVFYTKSRALLIGNAEYKKTPAWSRLPSIPGEMATLRSALEGEGIEVEVHSDLTSAQLPLVLKRFLQQGHGSQTRLIVFFAGHGWTDRDFTGYILPVDAPAPSDPLYRSMLTSMAEIKAWADDSDANHIMFFFDSCFSGTVFLTRRSLQPPPLFVKSALRRTRQFITAGDEREEVPAVSDFVPALIRGLQGEADIVKDGIITGNELGYWLSATLTKLGRQTPQYGSVGRLPGDVVFTYASKHPAIPTGQLAKASEPKARSETEAVIRSLGVPESANAHIFAGIEISYYQKAADGRTVMDALDARKIPHRVTRALLPETFKTNAIACGPDTPVDALKELAYSMLDAGIPLRVILKFQYPDAKKRRFEIISTSKDLEGKIELDSPPLSRAQIGELTSCPQVLRN